MVGQETFFNGAMSSSDEVRMAAPRLDFRWRYIPTSTQQEASLPLYEQIYEQEAPFFVEGPPEAEENEVMPGEIESDFTPPPIWEVTESSASPEPVSPTEEKMSPQIMLLQIARMYEDEWRLTRVETSTDKSYAFLLPRNCKLSLKQAIKRRKALVITMDRHGKLSIQDLRKMPPRRKDSWWKHIFGWF